VEPTSAERLRARPARRLFRRAASEDSPGFLQIHRSWFAERDAAGQMLASRGGELLIGVDDFDLPAAQCFNGNSELLVIPAWRLPHEIASLTAARAWVAGRLESEYGLGCGEVWELGGPYHPTPGVTPEVVHPFAVEAVGDRPGGKRRLHWVPLRELVRHEELL